MKKNEDSERRKRIDTFRRRTKNLHEDNSVLDESTDDYLYLYDLINKKLYFTDKICEKYSIPSGMEGIPIESWIRIVYPKDQKNWKKALMIFR